MGAEQSQYAPDVTSQIKDKIKDQNANISRLSNFSSQKSINMGPNFGSGQYAQKQKVGVLEQDPIQNSV